MARLSAALALVALAALGMPRAPAPAPLRFKEEAVTIRYSATERLASLVFEAESEEPVGGAEVRHRSGGPALGLVLGDARSTVSGFVIESAEVPLEELLELYPAGLYAFRGRSVDGRSVRGSGTLAHALPEAPVITFPRPGARDVPADDLVVRWARDANALGYEIVLEQGDNDGLSVRLPAGSDSLQVTGGLLAGGTETHLEVAAIGATGNRTQVELAFTTR